MTAQPESLLTFPCEFTIKVFGKKSEEFEAFVISTIHAHCKDLRENAFNYRDSKDKTYLAISVTIHAESKEQLDTIYRALSSNSNVLMVI